MHIPFFRAKPTFWTGRTSRRINSLAQSDTVRILAFYLFTAPDATPFGLYPLKLTVASIHTNKTTAELIEAFVHLQEFEFAQHDEETEFVWIYEMADEQLNLPLKEMDWKSRWAAKWWSSLEDNPFIEPFYERYRDSLHLPARKLLRSFQAPSKGLESPIRGIRGIRDNCTDTETVSVLKHEPVLKHETETETETEKGGRGENKTPAQILNESWRLVVDAAEKWFSQKAWAHLATTRLVKIDEKQRYVIWCPSIDHKKVVNDNAAKLREIAHGLGFKVNRFIFQEARQRVEVKK